MMKTIEERAKEYAQNVYGGSFGIEIAFIRGARSEHEELIHWHDPKEKLPDDDREVLCIVNRQYNKFAVLSHDNYGWWQYVPFQGGGWCGYDGEIIGWRDIHE